MKLIVPKGEITLPSGFSFEITMNNPIYSDEGSSSIPITIPASAENLFLLGFPNRLGQTSPVRTLPAILSHGVFHMKGELVMSAAGSSSGISCVFLTKESQLYSSLQEKSLKRIFEKAKNLIFGSATPAGNVDAALWQIYANEGMSLSELIDGGDGIAAFPVKVEDDGYGFQMLNEPLSEGGFVSASRTLNDDDGNSMQYPFLYGITAFIHLWKMIDLAFSLEGYTVRTNSFRKPPYEDLVVLNNCADTCVQNSILFSDLVPDITMGEFMIWLKDKFGGVIFFDGKAVDVLLTEECLSSFPDRDVSPCARIGETLNFPVTSSVVVDCDKSLEGAEPASDLSIGDFLSRYDYFWMIRSIPATEDSLPVGIPVILYAEGNVALRTSQGGIRNKNYVCNILGSTAFAYSCPGVEDSEDKKAEDKYVPMYVDRERSLLLPFVGSSVHLHTSIKDEDDQSSEQPLMVCWKIFDSSTNHYVGSTQPYGFYGDRASVNHYPLTPDGIYHMFWRTYNKALIGAAPTIEVQLDLSVSDIICMDLSKPKIMNGQRVMIKSMTVEVSSSGVRCGKCMLQHIPAYTNNINDHDIYSSDCLTWRYFGLDQKRSDSGVVVSDDGLTDYSYNMVSGYVPGEIGEILFLRTRTGYVTYPDDYNGRQARVTWNEGFIAVLKG